MKIKTAILGYGRSGSTLHADSLETLGHLFEVNAICDINPQAREKGRERFTCPGYMHYHEMLKSEDLDLVVIVTRSDQHCEMACDCLRAGVNVLVTKPWAVNADEAERMIAAARKSARQLLPWLPARWGCDLARLREILASGMIGEVFMVRRREFNFGIRTDWQTEKRYGGGYLLNWGPHIVDQAVQLVGEPVVSAYGLLRQVINPGDVEDVFHTLLTTQSGVILNCEYSMAVNKLPNWVIQGSCGTIFVKETSIEIHHAEVDTDIDPEAYGTALKIQLSSEELADGHRITVGSRYGDSLVVYPAIAKALHGETPYPVTTDSALALSRILDAIRQSSQTNQVISLAWT